MPKLIYFLVGLLGINLIIGVHELGHFLMCRAFKVAVPEVSIGIGPTLASHQFATTKLMLALVPLGGYVEILGMRAPAPFFENVSFASKPLNQKLLILLGGIIGNIVTAFFLLFFVPFRRRRRNPEPEVSPENPGDTGPDESGIIGPIGIFALIARSAHHGISTYLRFLGVLSLSLAVFNLLPIPLLDGGQILITIIEYLRGSPFDNTWYNLIMLLGTIPLIFLLLKAMRSDIRKLIA